MNDKEIDKTVEFWAFALAERLFEMKMFDKEKIKLATKVHFVSALNECTQAQITSSEKEYNEIRHSLNSFYGNDRLIRTKRLGVLRDKIKSQNKLRDRLRKQNKLSQLIAFVKEKNPDLLLDFYRHWETIDPRMEKSTVTKKRSKAGKNKKP